MILFLTSSPCVEGKGDINPANGFRDELVRRVPRNARAVFVTATPDNVSQTEWAAYSMKQNLEEAGIVFGSYYVLDKRNAHCAANLVINSDFVILGGGHVPTQHRFFEALGLAKLLRNYDGVVMGISAGTMNCAEVVYSQPEEPGESVAADYKRFFNGLNLTKKQVLPHFQKSLRAILDGKRLIEDITFADSIGQTFYGLPDGSYIFADGQTEEIRGEYYLIRDGRLEHFC